MTPLRIAIDNMALITLIACAAWLALKLEAWVRRNS